MAIRRNPGFDVFNVRLLIGLDKLLREKRRYQGDLSVSINDALLAVNLNIVKLVTLQGKKPSGGNRLGTWCNRLSRLNLLLASKLTRRCLFRSWNAN